MSVHCVGCIVWCLLSSCKTVRTLWAELGDDKVAAHYRGVVRASVLRRMDRQPALRRLSWSHMTAWSDDTEYKAARGRRRLSHWRISADCALFFSFIMDAVVFLCFVATQLGPCMCFQGIQKGGILFVTCFMLCQLKQQAESVLSVGSRFP